MPGSPRGYSVHIGLNRVDPNAYGGWDGRLNACVNDAVAMEALAAAGGYTTHRLVDEAATRDAVIQSIRAAAADLKAGDIFLLSCSSHGGSMPNVPGGDVEPDGNDETWCLYDGQLIDDELELLWHEFEAGVRVLLVSDSCHSETIARVAMPAFNFVAVAGDAVPTRLMPIGVQYRVHLAHKDFYRGLQVAAKTALDAKGAIACTVRTLAGCRDDELSYDGPQNGEFTRALLAAWNFGRFRGNYAAFLAAIASRITTGQHPQHNVVGRADPAFDAQAPFAIAASPARAAPTGDWERATTAIESYVRDRHRSDLPRWRSVVPKDDWGMVDGAWRDAGGSIIDRFNSADASGPQIDVTDPGVRNGIAYHRDKTLAEFHEYVVERAANARSAARLAVREAAVLGNDR